jgi:hypothetical protein
MQIENLWNDEDYHCFYFEAMYGYADRKQSDKILKFLKDNYLTPEGRYFMYFFPNGRTKCGEEDLTNYKMIYFLTFIPALEKLGEEDLLDEIVKKTYDGIMKCGDFWESQYVDGGHFGNGPMSIFGAFGYIWSLMDQKFRNGRSIMNNAG